MRRDVTSGSASGPLKIRVAQPHERAALEDLQRRSSLALPKYREQLLANPEAIHLPQEQVDRGDAWVAEVSGELAGFAVLDGGELDGLFVDPSRWRMGIGAALVEVVAHEARRRGLSLTVTAAPEAREFYERCGFTVEGETETRFGPAIRMSR
jgi:GNAT superfamily N-acetyltransferase